MKTVTIRTRGASAPAMEQEALQRGASVLGVTANDVTLAKDLNLRQTFDDEAPFWADVTIALREPALPPTVPLGQYRVSGYVSGDVDAGTSEEAATEARTRLAGSGFSFMLPKAQTLREPAPRAGLPAHIVYDTSGIGYLYARDDDGKLFTLSSAVEFCRARNGELKTATCRVMEVGLANVKL